MPGTKFDFFKPKDPVKKAKTAFLNMDAFMGLLQKFMQFIKTVENIQNSPKFHSIILTISGIAMFPFIVISLFDIWQALLMTGVNETTQMFKIFTSISGLALKIAAVATLLMPPIMITIGSLALIDKTVDATRRLVYLSQLKKELAGLEDEAEITKKRGIIHRTQIDAVRSTHDAVLVACGLVLTVVLFAVAPPVTVLFATGVLLGACYVFADAFEKNPLIKAIHWGLGTSFYYDPPKDQETPHQGDTFSIAQRVMGYFGRGADKKLALENKPVAEQKPVELKQAEIKTLELQIVKKKEITYTHGTTLTPEPKSQEDQPPHPHH
ncbi:MAG TPA: hypothetical protein VNC84_03825 [Gammaproteobacteria bacterium]|jgi:hypothetical protein|nr:hypothetical protein [Gammaproteobacteria bacterium]